MTIQQVGNLHQARQFQSFRVHLADGRALEISHPELLAIVPPGRTIVVATGNENFEIVDLLLVTSLGASNGHPKSGKWKS